MAEIIHLWDVFYERVAIELRCERLEKEVRLESTGAAILFRKRFVLFGKLVPYARSRIVPDRSHAVVSNQCLQGMISTRRVIVSVPTEALKLSSHQNHPLTQRGREKLNRLNG